MQLVVVMAVRKAVSAATITFTAISITLFFIGVFSFFRAETQSIAETAANLSFGAKSGNVSA